MCVCVCARSVSFCWHRNKRKWLIIYPFDDNLCWHINRSHVYKYVEIVLIVAAAADGFGWQEKVTHEWACTDVSERQRVKHTVQLEARAREGNMAAEEKKCMVNCVSFSLNDGKNKKNDGKSNDETKRDNIDYNTRFVSRSLSFL